jgi:benzaldehyde dehydrogenase (NAD)
VTTVRDATFDVFRRFGMTRIFANPGSTEIAFLTDLPDDLRFVLREAGACREGRPERGRAGRRGAQARPAHRRVRRRGLRPGLRGGRPSAGAVELGGNSALIVLDDVDLEKAVSVGAFGSFNHAGQICMATGRHLVSSTIAADYAAALAEHADHIPVGDPTRDDVGMGPIIDAAQRDKVHRVVTASVDAGAQLRAGGTYEGLFYRPTVLSDVPLTAPAYVQETFGPVAPVVAFADLDQAVTLAAGTEYGLSLGILTRDVMKGLALAERIPSGLMHINDQTVNDEALVPFGGVGESGTGSRHGGAQANLDAFAEVQWVTVRGDLPQYPF